jgi:hypothetical protein
MRADGMMIKDERSDREVNKKTTLAGSTIISLAIIGSGFAANNSVSPSPDFSAMNLTKQEEEQVEVEEQVVARNVPAQQQEILLTSGTYAIQVVREEVKIDLNEAEYVTVFNTLDNDDKTLTYYFDNMYPGARYRTVYGIKNVGTGVVKLDLDRLKTSLSGATSYFNVNIDNLKIYDPATEEEADIDIDADYAEIPENGILRFRETVECTETVLENTEYEFSRSINFFS